MKPTRLTAPGSSMSSEDFDAPAYTRALTPLPEIERRQAIEAAGRTDAGNRTFNQQFWATLASEAGGVPSGIGTGRLARLVSGILKRSPRGSSTSGNEAGT